MDLFASTVSFCNSYPRLIHVVWLNFQPDRPARALDAEQLRMVYSWRFFNPAWRLLVWRDAEVDALLLGRPAWRARYMALEPGAQRADFARLAILYEHGGLYVDVDMLCLRAIDEEVMRLRPLACYMVDDYGADRELPPVATLMYGGTKTNNNVILSVAGKLFMRLMLDNAPEVNGMANQEMDVVMAYGPFALQRLRDSVAWETFLDLPGEWNAFRNTSHKGASLRTLVWLYENGEWLRFLLQQHGAQNAVCVHFHESSWVQDKETLWRDVRNYYVWSSSGMVLTAVMLAVMAAIV